MKVKEKYAMNITTMALSNGSVTFDKNDLPIYCTRDNCQNCKFLGMIDCKSKAVDFADTEYVQKILRDPERAYLEFLYKHTFPKIKGFMKGEADEENNECIYYEVEKKGVDTWYSLPSFPSGTMYQGLAEGKEYYPDDFNFSDEEEIEIEK